MPGTLTRPVRIPPEYTDEDCLRWVCAFADAPPDEWYAVSNRATAVLARSLLAEFIPPRDAYRILYQFLNQSEVLD